MAVLSSMGGILSIILLITIGYWLAEKGWFSEESAALISRLVTGVSLPAYMVANLVTTFTRDKLTELAGGLLIPVASILISFLLSGVIARALGVEARRRGVFQTMFCVSNTIFIGLPVNLALFGEESLPYALLYYIANTVFFWTIGVYSISRDGAGEGAGGFSRQNLRRIFSPPLLGFMAGILLVMLQIPLPKFILDTCKYLGNLTTPLSMLFIGIAIHSVSLREIKISRDMGAVVLARFLVAPAVVIILAHFIRAPLLMKQVFIIQASLPIMTQVSIIAKVYHADHRYAAVVTTLTTVAAIVTIPLFVLLLEAVAPFINI